MLDSSSDSSSGSKGYWAAAVMGIHDRHTRSGVTPANIEAWNFAMLLIVHLPCSPNIQLITAVILLGPELVLSLECIDLRHSHLHTTGVQFCSPSFTYCTPGVFLCISNVTGLQATRSVYLIQRLSHQLTANVSSTTLHA